MEIRRAAPEEAAALTALALRSKAFWGYDAAFMARCEEELTLRPDGVLRARAHAACEGEVLLGFFTVIGKPPRGELDCLYVDPGAMGRGVGRQLLAHAKRVAHDEGFTQLVIHADPHAEAFYLREGAVRVGDVASGSIAGRALPLLELAT